MAIKDNKTLSVLLVSGDISLNGGKSRLTSTHRSPSSQTGGAQRMVNSSETFPSHPDLSALNTTSSPTHHTMFQCARTTNNLSSQHIHLTNTTMAHQSSAPSNSTNPLDFNSVAFSRTKCSKRPFRCKPVTTRATPLKSNHYQISITICCIRSFNLHGM